MKILYFADIENKKYPVGDIQTALYKLGNSVELVNEKDFKMEDLMKGAESSDLFLFHTGGVSTANEFEFQLSLTRLQNILQQVKCKKAIWFLDKVWGSGDVMMEQIIPFLTAAFLNDDTWVRRHKYPNTYCLHAGVGEKRKLGELKKEMECDVGFIGKIYGVRQNFVMALRQEYGRKFKVINNAYEKDFDDFCQSAKVIIDCQFPYDDFYWSDRIYRILGAGGFMMHPRLHGLGQEFKDKKHYKNFFTWDEMTYYINHYLKNEKERKEIAEAGRDWVYKNYSYRERLKELIKKTNESQNLNINK